MSLLLLFGGSGTAGPTVAPGAMVIKVSAAGRMVRVKPAGRIVDVPACGRTVSVKEDS